MFSLCSLSESALIKNMLNVYILAKKCAGMRSAYFPYVGSEMYTISESVSQLQYNYCTNLIHIYEIEITL